MILIGFPGDRQRIYLIERKINIIRSITKQDIKSYGCSFCQTAIESLVLYNHIAIVFLRLHGIFFKEYHLQELAVVLQQIMQIKRFWYHLKGENHIF